MTPLSALEYMLAHPKIHLSREECADFLRMVLGSKMYREVFNPRTSAKRSRKEVIHGQLWSALKRPLKQKLANHNRLRAERPPETLAFWDSVTLLYEETLRRLETAQLRNPGMTPAQVADELSLPNAGLYWVDWVPPKVRKAYTLEGERVYAPRNTRFPAVFTVPESERTRARRENHSLLLGADVARYRLMLTAAQEGPNNAPRTRLHLAVQIRAASASMHALAAWPRTRAVPIDPLQCGGFTQKHIDDALGAASMPADADDAYLRELVGTVIKDAQARFANAQAQTAKYKRPSPLENATTVDAPLPTVAQRRAERRKRMTKSEVYQRDEALGRHTHRPVIEGREMQDVDDVFGGPGAPGDAS